MQRERWKGAYFWPEDHGAIQEDCIVLGNGKVMHHDAAWYGDGHAAQDMTRGICNLVRHMGCFLDTVPKEEQFTCSKSTLIHNYITQLRNRGTCITKVYMCKQSSEQKHCWKCVHISSATYTHAGQ